MAVRVVVLLGLALIIGVGTVIFAKQWIDGQRQPAPPPDVVEREVVPDLFVLVAQGNLQPGTLISMESLRWQGWPTEDIPPSYIVQGQRSETEFVGAVVRRPIAAGEPMTDFKVAKPGEQGFLAAVLEPGMRAVTLPISPIRASAGFILPGDRVDVLLTHDPGSGTVTETVFFDMEVLAIDQALASGEGAVQIGGTATLEVTPREVEAFTLMQQMGTMTLALRSLQPGEGEETKPQPMGADDQTEQMVGEPEPKPGGAEQMAEIEPSMAEKPEVIDKVPTVYPGEVPEEPAVADGAPPPPPLETVDNAVGQSLGRLDDVDLEDEHSIRRQDQTFTSTRDISVLIGGGGGAGAVVVIRGN